MRHAFLDRYSRLVSPIHGLSIPCKLASTMILLITIVTLPAAFYGVFAGLLLLLCIVAILSRIPMLFLLKRMALLEVFVLMVSLLSLLQPNGIIVFSRLVLKSSLCLFTIVLFSNTTPFAKLLEALRKWRVPDLLITLLALMYRYLFVLIDEMERMQRARASRTFVRKRSLQWRSLAVIMSQLFIRSTGRAEKIFASMCARGWQ
jgi:cobalt/nickel transport system permease protein